jgi:protein-disulfide isomerase
MSRLKPWTLLAVALLLAGGTLYAYFGLAFKRPQPRPEVKETPVAVSPDGQPLVTFIDPARGAERGEALIVEYGDYFCPFCREAEDDIARLIAAYPERVRFVWKDLPSQLHPGADIAAEGAHCAKAQGKFWEFHDRLMRENSYVNQSRLILLAGDFGLDTEAFGTCLTAREMKPLIDRTIAEAESLGIDATPTFFINGKRYAGQLTYSQLEEAIGAQ